jgi:hypothetical protein
MQQSSQQQQQSQGLVKKQAAKPVAKPQPDTPSLPLCPKCSTEIPEGANFCPECGEPITEEALVQTQAEQEAIIEPEVIKEEPVRKSLFSGRQLASIKQTSTDINNANKQRAEEAARLEEEKRQAAEAMQKAAETKRIADEAERQRQIHEAQIQTQAKVQSQVLTSVVQDPMLGTYVCKRYGDTLIFDSSTHALEIDVGVNRNLGSIVKRELSVTVNGSNVTLNEISNNYSSLSNAQQTECFLPLATLFKGSFNGKKTVLKGYWYHQSGHTSSHFVFDKVKK